MGHAELKAFSAIRTVVLDLSDASHSKISESSWHWLSEKALTSKLFSRGE